MWVVGLGLLSLAICWKARARRNLRTAAAVRWLGAALAVAAVAYMVGVKGMSYVDVRLVTREHAEDKLRSYERRIRLMGDLVPPDAPILATVFSPRWYLLARRLPSSGNYYYLPWQAAYNRDPVLGRQIDICADVDRDRPKVIVWDRWRVWERYSLEDYEPCLVERMRRDYLKIQRTPFLVRRPVGPGDRETIRRHGFSLAPLSPGG
jgi:hypothetical protein